MLPHTKKHGLCRFENSYRILFSRCVLKIWSLSLSIQCDGPQSGCRVLSPSCFCIDQQVRRIKQAMNFQSSESVRDKGTLSSAHRTQGLMVSPAGHIERKTVSVKASFNHIEPPHYGWLNGCRQAVACLSICTIATLNFATGDEVSQGKVFSRYPGLYNSFRRDIRNAYVLHIALWEVWSP